MHSIQHCISLAKLVGCPVTVTFNKCWSQRGGSFLWYLPHKEIKPLWKYTCGAHVDQDRKTLDTLPTGHVLLQSSHHSLRVVPWSRGWHCLCLCHVYTDRLVGLVVRCPPQERKIPGSNPACAGIFSGSSHSKIGTPYRVSTGTGQPGVSILWLGEVERWICNFYLSVAARKLVWADPSLRYTSMLLGRLSKPTNKLPERSQLVRVCNITRCYSSHFQV